MARFAPRAVRGGMLRGWLTCKARVVLALQIHALTRMVVFSHQHAEHSPSGFPRSSPRSREAKGVRCFRLAVLPGKWQYKVSSGV